MRRGEQIFHGNNNLVESIIKFGKTYVTNMKKKELLRGISLKNSELELQKKKEKYILME